jgi:hypothetical protein
VPGHYRREPCSETSRPEDSCPGTGDDPLRFRQVWISRPVIHFLGDEDAKHVNENDGGYVYSECHEYSVQGGRIGRVVAAVEFWCGFTISRLWGIDVPRSLNYSASGLFQGIDFRCRSVPSSKGEVLKFVMSLSALILIAAVACGGDDGEIGGQPPAGLMAIAEEYGMEEELITVYSGLESTVEGPFTLKKGIMIMSGSSDGGLFSALLKQDDHLDKELVFNEPGKYRGQSVISVPASGDTRISAGSATLEVTTFGNKWGFEYTQELPGPGKSVPFEFSGTGDGISPALDLKTGAYTVTAEKEDIIGFFSVHLLPADGSIQTSFTNVGDAGVEFDGTFDFEIKKAGEFGNQPGTWIFDVDAPGDWTVSIK